LLFKSDRLGPLLGELPPIALLYNQLNHKLAKYLLLNNNRQEEDVTLNGIMYTP